MRIGKEHLTNLLEASRVQSGDGRYVRGGRVAEQWFPRGWSLDTADLEQFLCGPAGVLITGPDEGLQGGVGAASPAFPLCGPVQLAQLFTQDLKGWAHVLWDGQVGLGSH
ncbi:hypothetical protein LG634_17000 [Streptomyces bambusae]|uniref:hypothetical protein n=1 Tax=Streptomyces bambusae TaxID=1550616 RepID=UPI001CFD10B7|nr:hypothetical protein [Streptomyces bambusae]MCB5166531.1 hypothetical protein [Streptomyces bambusae]